MNKKSKKMIRRALNNWQRPERCGLNRLIFDNEEEIIIAVRCNCGSHHPVRYKSSHVLWDKEFIGKTIECLNSIRPNEWQRTTDKDKEHLALKIVPSYNRDKPVGVKCMCGKIHPVRTYTYTSYGDVNGFEALLEVVSYLKHEVDWEKEGVFVEKKK